MSRHNLVAAAIALSCLAPASAAPALKGKEVALYYPTREGDKLEYEYQTGGPAGQQITEEVTKVEKKDGGLLVSVVRELNGRATVPSQFLVSDKGVSRVATAGRDLPVPIPLLKLPGKPGDTWTYEPPNPGGGVVVAKTTYTMGKEEDVEIPAGKFRALRVEAEQDLGGRVYKTTAWYAPGVGLVKSVMNTGGLDRTQVLKSFTRGK